jgi:phosphoglycolate phosphatase-like HAD superfamily hydrolase
MSQAIVFFDIDGVIFDAKKFFISFYEKFAHVNNLTNEQTEKLKELYGEVKKEKGFFDPQVFLAKILSQYSIAKEDLERLWWDEKSFRECLLVDEDFLKQIQEKAIIGIFSKGEINFQKKKIEKFASFFKSQDIYIFEDKIVKINEVLAKYKNYQIYVVDDNVDVLESFKQIDNLVYTVLIREEQTESSNNKTDSVIDNVLQLVPLLTQKLPLNRLEIF